MALSQRYRHSLLGITRIMPKLILIFNKNARQLRAGRGEFDQFLVKILTLVGNQLQRVLQHVDIRTGFVGVLAQVATPLTCARNALE